MLKCKNIKYVLNLFCFPKMYSVHRNRNRCYPMLTLDKSVLNPLANYFFRFESGASLSSAKSCQNKSRTGIECLPWRDAPVSITEHLDLSSSSDESYCRPTMTSVADVASGIQ